MRRMSRVAATKARPRRAASPERTVQVEPPIRPLGRQVETEFRKAAAKAIDDAHAARVPVAILTDEGQVAWLYPDGTVRARGP